MVGNYFHQENNGRNSKCAILLSVHFGFWLLFYRIYININKIIIKLGKKKLVPCMKIGNFYEKKSYS